MDVIRRISRRLILLICEWERKEKEGGEEVHIYFSQERSLGYCWGKEGRWRWFGLFKELESEFSGIRITVA